MYDFYGNPPQTKEDIREYLTSWLQKVSDLSGSIVIKNETFVPELGFRRAFDIHTVYRSLLTNEYLWWVSEYPDLETFPTKRYPTYEALLEDVINEYYIRWKLAK